MLLQRRQSAPGAVLFVIGHAAHSFPSEEVRLAFGDGTKKIVGWILNEGTNGITIYLRVSCGQLENE